MSEYGEEGWVCGPTTRVQFLPTQQSAWRPLKPSQNSLFSGKGETKGGRPVGGD